MKNYLFIILFIFFYYSFTQEEKRIFIEFDSNSKSETCKISKEDRGRYHTISETKKFTKIVQKNGNIDFYICKELFSHKKEKDTCNSNYLRNIKFSKIEDLKKTISKINPLYPSKVYPNIYMVEKINDSVIVNYKVKWEYYIE